MARASFAATEILQQLDDCARLFTFPMLDNGYVYLADTRLSAYRDDSRWALVVEVLGTNFRDGVEADSLYCFGNCLNQESGLANGGFITVLGDDPKDRVLDDEHHWFLAKEVGQAYARSLTLPFDLTSPTSDEVIEVADADELSITELIRSLLPEQRRLLLATEEELRQRLSADVPLILRLDEWYHPDLALEELPSDSPTFQMIAEVLVSGDPSLYRPAHESNTHWRNWPDSGTL